MRLAKNATKLTMLVILTLQLSSCGESADHLANEGEYEAVSLEKSRNIRRELSPQYPFEPAKPNDNNTSPVGNSSGGTVNPPPPPNGGTGGSTNPVVGGNGGNTNPNGGGTNPNPVGNTGGNNQTLPAVAHTIDIHSTVWFPNRRGSGPNATGPFNTAGEFTARKNEVVAIKVDFADPAINFTFHPNASAATLFQAIYKWSSVENQNRIAAHHAVITPLAISRNTCLNELAAMPARPNLGSCGQAIDVCESPARPAIPATATHPACPAQPDIRQHPYCIKKRACAGLQRDVTRANAAYPQRYYDDNMLEVSVVDEQGNNISNNPSQPYGCLSGGFMSLNTHRIDFPFVQRPGQFHLQNCASVGPNKKWFIRLKVNHCDYTYVSPNGSGRGSDANCQLKLEVFRDTFYFN